MNKKRREKLMCAKTHLNAAEGIISSTLEEERDTLSNWPEQLQESERFEQYDLLCDEMEEAIESIQSATSLIYNIVT